MYDAQAQAGTHTAGEGWARQRLFRMVAKHGAESYDSATQPAESLGYQQANYILAHWYVMTLVNVTHKSTQCLCVCQVQQEEQS